ncbi:ferredoxin [Streptomyces sp. NPDC059460]|uniref:ferredoxin n=1 Tax=Streptomyces sp. NPDC059460 TaxID=3346840 RepID=UPI0036C9CBA4
MKVHVEASKCDGYGLCHEVAPQLFELDEWGYASAVGYGVVPAGQEEIAGQAERSCPNLAVVLEED